MKPIYLKMTAFGSYCGTAEVDFTKLYDNGIFLITGKTGGGKTTILDAICMALYGKATGSERAKEWRQMRCNNAPNSVDTEIEYIFSIDRTKYKFYRRWRIPKTRNGEFKIDDSENACYLRRDDSDDWEPIATGKSKALSDAAENILKLSQSQFVKVIMLPQGEFRELLTATSDEKEKIFKRLFDTERWEEITARISEEFTHINNQCKEHQNRRAMALTSAECETPAELDAKIEQCRVKLSELTAKAEQNAKKSERTAAQLKSAEEDAALFKELAEQKSALENLNSCRAKYDEAERKLLYSRTLRGVLPQFNLMKAAQTAENKAAVLLTRAKAAEQSAKTKLSEAQKNAEGIPALEEKKRGLLTAQANYSTLSESRASHDTSEIRLKKNQNALKEAQENLLQLRQSKAELESKIVTGNEYLEECYAATEQLNSVNENCRALSELYTNLCDLDVKTQRFKKLTKSIAEIQKKINAEEDNLHSLEAIANAVEQAILSDKAYSLAADLTEGAPCPVCGSTHHPQPAHPADSTPNAAELEICRSNIEKSNKKSERLRGDYSAANAELAVINQDISQIKQKLGDNSEQNADEIKVQLEAAKNQAEELQKRSGQTTIARKRLKQRNDELSANAHDIENTVTHINNLNIQITSDEQNVKSIDEQLKSQGISDFSELDKKIKACKAALARIEADITALNSALTEASAAYSSAQATLTAAVDGLTHAQSALNARRTEFRDKCQEIGISEVTDIEGGVLPDKTEAEYDAKISSYKQQLAFAQKRIEELTNRLNGKTMPDLAALRTANSAAIAEGQEIAKLSGDTARQMKFFTDTSEIIRTENEFLDEHSKPLETARRMNQLFSGINEARTPIHQYVIGIKMDEVIMSANIYMHRLTRGQYAMKRKDSVGGRAKHQGLDIEIIDSSAGRVRAVSTLSGGELFLASLSLAFGLSDVVQSFAGGIHLDSLFIDEGFGSLDSETLDTAMDAITQVRENKLLGIISHVSELKERISCGIEVVKTPDGSALKMRI
ncbi:MAG: SbcC/MukB-like Walker B domain-containing protein [Acutalibacteraceae bacterium]